jgi:hypothetical protein
MKSSGQHAIDLLITKTEENWLKQAAAILWLSQRVQE